LREDYKLKCKGPFINSHVTYGGSTGALLGWIIKAAIDSIAKANISANCMWDSSQYSEYFWYLEF